MQAALPEAVFDKIKDPGALAAALYCWPGQPREWIDTRLRRISAGLHAGLVWRGYLLGRGGATSVAAYRDAGINRVSLGIQSFNPRRTCAAGRCCWCGGRP